jgi:simple sugar transport system ATP-binding protein/ribose transport system ATP-binding protein
MSGATPFVDLRGITKHFGGVQALNDVTLTISEGTIHGLVGENGAGKSTLGKVIAGVISPDQGELNVHGRSVQYRSPRQALEDGITIIAQELALVPERSVIENIFLGAENRQFGVVDRRALRERYARLNEETHFELRPGAIVGSLRLADRQKVEILRALVRGARMIVMDEPTAALGRDEAERLFETIRGLRARGATIVYVSHFLREVLDLVDTVTVLRDGRLVRTATSADETPERLVTAMIGRAVDLTFPAKAFPAADAPVALAVSNLSCAAGVTDVSFAVRSGEIVGLAGLVGSGRSELARAIVGADRCDSGTVHVGGAPIKARSPRDAIARGLVMVPEDRKGQGLLMLRSVLENITLPYLSEISAAGVITAREERRRARALIAKLDVRARSTATPVNALSGGNQQKVLFARWLFSGPRVLIADEPTRGVDVGAKRAIYELLSVLAAAGTAVLLISSEVEEIIGLSHRILVMRGGRLVTELDGRTASEDEVMHAAFATEAFAA